MTTQTTAHSVEVGDIFTSSWGYDQTNVDFYEVVRTTPKSVEIRAIGTRVAQVDSVGNERVEPAPGKFTGEPMLKRVQRGWKGGPLLRIASYAIATPYEGVPKHRTGPYNGH